jgi:allantoin racemase
MTALLGVPFSVVSIGKNARNKIGARLGAYGLANFRSAVGIDLGVLDLDKNVEGTAEVIVQCAKQEMKQYGSEAILLGCTGMAQAARPVAEKLNAPVVEPSSAAIKALECLVSLGLRHHVGGLFSKADASKIKE